MYVLMEFNQLHQHFHAFMGSYKQHVASDQGTIIK